MDSIMTLIIAPVIVGVVITLFDKWLDNRSDD